MFSAIPVIGQSLTELRTYRDNYSVYSINILKPYGFISKYQRSHSPAKTISEQLYYLSISYRDIAVFVGLIDGDGSIIISKNSKDTNGISAVLSINLHVRDYEFLLKLQRKFRIGNVRINGSFAVYVISRTELQDVLFPLMIHHGIEFLNKGRKTQFLRFQYIVERERIVFYHELPSGKDLAHHLHLPATPKDYIKLPYFMDWLIGFTIAEGSFHINKNGDACCSIKQKEHYNLMYAIKLFFDTKVNLDSHGGNNKISMSSKEDLQKVIDFYSNEDNMPLSGYKYLQYNQWLYVIKRMNRYKTLIYPLQKI